MIDRMIHRIKIRQSELHVAFSQGTPMTWEAYQRMVGEFQGLQGALDILDAILEEDKNQD